MMGRGGLPKALLLLGMMVSLLPSVQSFHPTVMMASSRSNVASKSIVPSRELPPKKSFSWPKKFYAEAFLPPWGARDTIRSQVSDDIFLFEQAQTFVNVSVNIRMTIVRLKNGELFVHAPVAPTDECITMLTELGPVGYIVLPVTAIEHKVYVRPFVSKFPNAKVYIAPGQYSFPLNLPLGFKVNGILTDDAKDIPFRDEIDFTGWAFSPFVGSIAEVAFFHKASKTLLVTDAVIYIDDKPPAVLQAKGVKTELWKKMALQACFLGPPNLDTFDIVSKKLFVSPVISILVVSRAKKEVAEWINRLCQWKFDKIIPAHFSAPIRATPKDLREAYSFLLGDPVVAATLSKQGHPPSPAPIFDLSSIFGSSNGKDGRGVQLPAEDVKILNALDKFVSSNGLA